MLLECKKQDQNGKNRWGLENGERGQGYLQHHVLGTIYPW